MDAAKFIKPIAFISVLALIGQSLAQEVTFADYMQPPQATRIGHVTMDNSAFYNVGVTAYSIGVNFHDVGYINDGVRLNNWPVNGDAENNGDSGLGVPMYGTFDREIDYLDVSFMYKPESGAPKKFRLDLYNGTYWEFGSPINGGLVNLTGAVGSWSRFRIRRLNTSSDGFGTVTKPTGFRLMAIQNTDNNYPAFGGSYNTASGITFDCFRVTAARRLNGLAKVTGTTNKNVGTVLFGNSGGLLQYNDWIQNLGNVDLVNIYGFTNLGYANNSSQTSGLMYTYLDGGSVRQFGFDRFQPTLDAVATNTWIGMGQTGNPVTDKFFGFNGQSYPCWNAAILRQVTTGVFSHYIRTLNSSSNGYASEVPVNLGGERLVAVADVNGDSMDDAITRQGTLLRVRLWNGESGAWPNSIPTFAAATTLSTFGYLKILGVTDFNDDGIQDLVLNDSVSGDVFSLMNTPSGSTLTWIFQINASQQEKVYAFADADNDGYPDVYSTRQVSPGVGEINIRKMNPTGTSIQSFGLVAQYNYTGFAPCAIGDINGDATADVVMLGNDNPNYSVISFLVNPLTRGLLKTQWVCNANTPTVRPIFAYGSN